MAYRQPLARGYLPQPCSLYRRGEYAERCKLLVMSALYILIPTYSHFGHWDWEKFSLFPWHIHGYGRWVHFHAAKFNGPLWNIKMVLCSWIAWCLRYHGRCGTMDVVHVKWSNCPAGDHNQSKGNEGYPMLGFQCITDFNRLILAVYGPQLGAINDKQIVKIDTNVRYVRFGWLSKVMWRYWGKGGIICWDCYCYCYCYHYATTRA